MLIDLLGAASSEEHLVMVTILLERALSASVTVLSSISWQVLLLSCFFLASKDLDDDPVSFRDLRMLAVMHDVRSAATGGLTPQKGAQLSSCYNEDIEDIEIALLYLLGWSTYCSGHDYLRHRQRYVDRAAEAVAAPSDGMPGITALAEDDLKFLEERAHLPAVQVGSMLVEKAGDAKVGGLEETVLDAVESFLGDISLKADPCEGMPQKQAEDAAAFCVDPGEPLKPPPPARRRRRSHAAEAAIGQPLPSTSKGQLAEAATALMPALDPKRNCALWSPLARVVTAPAAAGVWVAAAATSLVQGQRSGAAAVAPPPVPKWLQALGVALAECVPQPNTRKPPPLPQRDSAYWPSCRGDGAELRQQLQSLQSWVAAARSGRCDPKGAYVLPTARAGHSFGRAVVAGGDDASSSTC